MRRIGPTYRTRSAEMRFSTARSHTSAGITARRNSRLVRGGVLRSCCLSAFLCSFHQIVNSVNAAALQGIRARGQPGEACTHFRPRNCCQPGHFSQPALTYLDFS